MDKRVLFIGGSPCGGKSTIAEYIARDYGAFYYKVDDYLDDFISKAAENGAPACKKLGVMSADEIWMKNPKKQCEDEFLIYKEISRFVFERLLSIDAKFVIAEGTAFTPEIMRNTDYEDYICIVPTPAFQISHYKKRDWISYVLMECTDKELAFDNWMQRDILFAKQVTQECYDNNIRCIVNDGLRSELELYEIVKQHFKL